MLSRDFTGPWQSRAILDTMQGLFLSELMRPSKELWLLSAWVSDIEVVDNSARSFGALRPDWPAAPLRLTEVLRAILKRGVRVAVVLRDEDHNQTLLRIFREMQLDAEGRLGLAVSPLAHEKTIVGDDYILGGSMNFTQNGLTVNEEHVLLRVDRAAAAARRVSLQERWGASLEWR